MLTTLSRYSSTTAQKVLLSTTALSFALALTAEDAENVRSSSTTQNSPSSLTNNFSLSRADSKEFFLTSPEYQRWHGYLANSPHTFTVEQETIAISAFIAGKDSKQTNVVLFCGTNVLTPSVMGNFITVATKYGDSVEQISRLLNQQRFNMPPLSNNPVTNYLIRAKILLSDEEYRKELRAITFNEDIDCKGNSLTVVACAINQYSQSLRPGASVTVEYVSGLYFNEVNSALGNGHTWVSVTAKTKSYLVEPSSVDGDQAIVRPAISRDRIPVIGYQFKVSATTDDRVTIDTKRVSYVTYP